MSFRISSKMGMRNEISLAFEKLLATRHPDRPATDEAESRLNIAVVYTSVEATVAALKKAGALAESLGARVTLVVPQVVPYHLPLESPPVLLEFSERRFREIASRSPVETRVHLYLCRDPLDTLMTVLKPRSLVVLGGRKRRWPTSEKSLARKLRRAGHEVVFTETG